MGSTASFEAVVVLMVVVLSGGKLLRIAVLQLIAWAHGPHLTLHSICFSSPIPYAALFSKCY
jgi:hypothetical protein